MSDVDLTAFVLLSLAAFRVTRLIQRDSIFHELREWFYGKISGRLLRLFTCTWCLGLWISVGWYAGWQWNSDVTLILAAPLAISAVVGLVSTIGE